MQIDNPAQEVVVVVAAVTVAEGFSLGELAGAACGFECELDEHAAAPKQTSVAMTTFPITPATRIPSHCMNRDLHLTIRRRAARPSDHNRLIRSVRPVGRPGSSGGGGDAR